MFLSEFHFGKRLDHFRQCWRGTFIHHLGMSREKLKKKISGQKLLMWMFLFQSEPSGIVSYYFTYLPNSSNSLVEPVKVKIIRILFYSPAKD